MAMASIRSETFFYHPDDLIDGLSPSRETWHRAVAAMEYARPADRDVGLAGAVEGRGFEPAGDDLAVYDEVGLPTSTVNNLDGACIIHSCPYPPATAGL